MTTMHESDLQATEGARGEPVRSPLKIDLAGVKKKSELKAAASDPELIRKSRLAFSESFGAAAWLLSHHSFYKNVSLQSLEAIVATPMRLGQFKIFRKDGVPFAYASWAYLDESTESRLRQSGDVIQPEDWNCGAIPWLIDLVAPFGGEDVVRKTLQDGLFDGQEIRDVFTLRNQFEAASQERLEAAHQLFRQVGASSGRIRIVQADAAIKRQFVSMAVPFAQLFLDGGNFAGLNLSPTQLIRTIGSLIDRPDAAVLVALADNIPCGAFLGEITTYAFGPQTFAREIAFVVHPAMRDRGVGGALLRHFEEWARSKGALAVQCIHSSGLAPDAADAAYSSIGAEPVGRVFVKRLMRAV